MVVAAYFFMLNIAKQYRLRNLTFIDSVKFTYGSTFVDALGPREAIEIKSNSNTEFLVLFGSILLPFWFSQNLDKEEKTGCLL